MPKLISEQFIIVRHNLLEIPEYNAEIAHVRKVLNIPLEEISPRFFFDQYAFVVICSYWKEQYARKEWEAFLKTDDVQEISNTRKREAVYIGISRYEDWFKELLKAPDKLEYLDSLPMIGEVTRCHLARNIGIDCVKPDRHLVRLAMAHGYFSPPLNPCKLSVLDQWDGCTRMCQDIQEDIGSNEKLGTIDVILWRACNLGWL